MPSVCKLLTGFLFWQIWRGSDHEAKTQGLYINDETGECNQLKLGTYTGFYMGTGSRLVITQMTFKVTSSTST